LQPSQPKSVKAEFRLNEWGRRGTKPEGKRPLGRQRRRWVDNIEMHFEEMGWGDVDWTGLAQDRDKWRALVNAVMNLRVP
jgi:hypothetical protein